MEFLKECIVAITISLLNKYLEKPGEKLGEKTTEQLVKLLHSIKALPENTFKILKPSQQESFPDDFEAAIKELETVANQNPELKQDIIDVVAAAKEEHPTEVQSIKDKVNRNKLQGITAEKINAVVQGGNISGGNVGNTGMFQVQGDNNIENVTYQLNYNYYGQDPHQYSDSTEKRERFGKDKSKGELSESLSSYQYDLFISYAEANKDWVKGFLLSALETAKIQYFERESFSLGVPKPQDLETFVRNSHYVLLIISDAYFVDNFNKFTDLLTQSYNPEDWRWRVFPLYLEPIELPQIPSALKKMSDPLDATDKNKWQLAIESLCKQIKHPRPKVSEKPKCPYPGMKTFNEEDSENFWGRDNEIDGMLRQLDNFPFLAIIGRSGIGKSSLVFAGLIPALKKSARFPGRWIIKTMRPGSTPVKTLEETLGGSSKELDATVKSFFVKEPNVQHLLLIVDQFEEIFTIVKEKKESQNFQLVLSQLIQIKNCYLVLTIRADFYQDLIGLQPLWEKIKNNRYELEPLTKDGLKNAILKPGKNVGVYIDSILVERLVGDFWGAKEPGILPFFQVTLRSLWEKLEYKYLPIHAYEKQGLDTIIAEFADKAWSALNRNQKKIARRIFLRLVQFGEGRLHTRRQQLVSELQNSNNDKEFKTVLNHFLNDQYRLLTISNIDKEENESNQIVDLAHEILISSWPKLQEWISQQETAEKERRELEKIAKEWADGGKHISGLLNADGVKKAEAWKKADAADYLGYSDDLATLIKRSQYMICLRRLGVLGVLGLITVSIITGNSWLKAKKQASINEMISVCTRPITPDLIQKVVQTIPDFLSTAKKEKTSRNFEKALLYYRALVCLKEIESKIESSPNPDDYSKLKPEREQIQKIAKQAEESLAEVISLAQIPTLEEQLKAGNFGERKRLKSDSEIEGDHYGPAAQDQQFTGALQTTYRILMMENGANADHNNTGLIEGKEELIPCATLKEIEILWRRYTQGRCGWYGKNSYSEAQDCQELGGKTLTIKIIDSFAHYTFDKRIRTQCKVVSLPVTEAEIKQ